MTTAIKIEHLSKKYMIGHQRQEQYTTIREVAMHNLRGLGQRIRHPLSPNSEVVEQEELWALRDINLDILQGERFGIIGRNGAGKSTLLKVLSRITEPTKGRFTLSGRIASLLEVGTGFHPELSGRENIFLNGAILGMSKVEIKRKFDEIVAFAETEKFLDTPVKRYSSGMYIRLAFAVAAHLEPEILIVDEVLAVGDTSFQKKCLGKMQEVGKEGRTVIFVSHQMDMVRKLTERCLLLDEGQVASCGTTIDVIDDYINSSTSSGKAVMFTDTAHENVPIQMLNGAVLFRHGTNSNFFDVFDDIVFEFVYKVRKPLMGAIVTFELAHKGTPLFISFDTDTDIARLESRAPNTYRCQAKIPGGILKPGHYSVSVHTGIANKIRYQSLENVINFEVGLVSNASTFLSYAEKRRGMIVSPLIWTVEPTDESK